MFVCCFAVARFNRFARSQGLRNVSAYTLVARESQSFVSVTWLFALSRPRRYARLERERERETRGVIRATEIAILGLITLGVEQRFQRRRTDKQPRENWVWPIGAYGISTKYPVALYKKTSSQAIPAPLLLLSSTFASARVFIRYAKKSKALRFNNVIFPPSYSPSRFLFRPSPLSLFPLCWRIKRWHGAHARKMKRRENARRTTKEGRFATETPSARGWGE